MEVWDPIAIAIVVGRELGAFLVAPIIGPRASLRLSTPEIERGTKQ